MSVPAVAPDRSPEVALADTCAPHARSQFAQQRLKKGAVIGGWVSSFYLLLPAGLTPFLGIYIDMNGQRIGFRECLPAESRCSPLTLCG